MKKFQLIIIVLFAFCFLSLNAQQKKYISYTVQKGETLKNLAKIYKISTRDLSRLNPGVKKKPRPNTVIIVPNLNFGKQIIDKNIEEEKVVTKNLYKVKPKETLYGISRRFGISIDELKTLNPILEEGLKIGMELEIPDEKNEEIETEQLKDSITTNITHTVVKDDTVYNLTKKYEITEEELYELNPLLNEGLKLGMELIVNIEKEVDDEEENLFIEDLDFSKEIKLALMLPYHTNKYDLDSVTEMNFEKSTSLLNIVTDFHLGAMMAIDSLKAMGLRINVDFFDTENSQYKLQYILNNNSFNNTDVIIGPLYFKKANWVASRVKTPVIAPVYSVDQESESDDNLIKSTVNTSYLEDKIINYFNENYDGENIVVINDEKPENQSKLWRIVNKIKEIEDLKLVSVIKTDKGYIDDKSFVKKLDTLSKNWVLLISDERIATTAAVNNLKTFAEDVDVRLFALDKGRNFDNIDNVLLGKLEFTYPTSDFINFEDSNVAAFYSKYWKKHKALPTEYSIKGFDVAYDAIVRISSNYDLKEGLKAGKSSRIATAFNYDKKMFGDFKNTNVFLVKYNEDLSTLIIK